MPLVLFIGALGEIGESGSPRRLLIRFERGLGGGRAIARDEHSEAILEIILAGEVRVVRLEPSHRPVRHVVGVGAGHRDSVGGDNDQVEFRVYALLRVLVSFLGLHHLASSPPWSTSDC
jgi:hypothetical protein